MKPDLLLIERRHFIERARAQRAVGGEDEAERDDRAGDVSYVCRNKIFKIEKLILMINIYPIICRYHELKHVVIVGDGDYIEREWDTLATLPKVGFHFDVLS